MTGTGFVYPGPPQDGSGAAWGRRPEPPRRGAYIAAGVVQLVLTGGLSLIWAFYALVESSSTAPAATIERTDTFVNFGPIALGISFFFAVVLLAVSGSWRGRGRLRPALAWADAGVIVGLVTVALVLFLRTRGA